MNDFLIHWFVVFVRVGALMAVLPAFSMTNVPPRVRVALALVLSLVTGPIATGPTPVGDHRFVAAVAGELGVGLILGFVCRMMVFTIEVAGALITTDIGLQMSSAFSPLTNSATNVPTTLLQWLGLMLMFALNLHHWMIAAIVRSYTLVPIGGFHVSEALANDLIRRSSVIFSIGVEMATPLMAVSFVITMVFALLNRAVPALNVFTDSFAIRILTGLSVFGMTVFLTAEHISNLLRRLPEDLAKVSSLIGGT